MKLSIEANSQFKPKCCITLFLQLLVVLIGLSACATAPNKEVYLGYSGTDLRETALATVELEGMNWAKFNDLHVEGQKYSAVKLRPGPYRIEYSKTWRVSFLVNPNMSVSRAVNGTVTLEAGRTYKLRAERTYGSGFTMYFWIEDEQGNVVIGTKKW